MIATVVTTIRRRLLRLLPRLGLQVVDVRPGTSVVSRSRRAITSRPISPGTTLLTEDAVVRRHLHEQDKALSAYLLTSLLIDLFERYEVDVVLDVGANKGQYARSLRRAGYRGRIVSFEPVPRDFEALQRRAAGDPQWEVRQLALGREDGSIEMRVVPGTFSSVLPPSEFGARRFAKLTAVELRTVPVRRLDGILDELVADMPGARPYLKLDTQGFDLEVFAGLGERARDVVAMQSEVAFVQIYEGMPRMPEALSAFEAAGFEVAGFYPVTRERRTARVLEFDCVLVRSASARGA